MAKVKPLKAGATGPEYTESGDTLDAKLNVSGPNVLLARLTSGEGGHEEIEPTDLTEETTPAAGDFLLGWESGGALRKFDVDNLSGGGVPYTTYVALISQSGTSDPTAVVLENTLGGSVTLARAGEGTYTITKTGAFLAAKTWYTCQWQSDGGGGSNGVFVRRTDDDTIRIDVPDGDGILNALPIEIRAYP